MNTPHDTDKSSERLNKFLARQLGISRREADVLIENETVTINNTLATLGARITPSDSIDVAGAPVSHKPAALRYIALNKPVGYVCSRRDDNRREWHVAMSEGRNRQIRRTFAALGYTVTRLHRTNFGNYALGDINRGEWRKVNIS